MGTGTILIVDDEVDALDNCRRILRRLGHDCLTEHDPVRAVRRIETERPALVLTDLRMPGLDGLTVLSETKRVDPNIQVVLLTAYATVQTAVESLRQGALDYILKPFTSQDLADVTRRAFGRQPPAETPAFAGNHLDRQSRPSDNVEPHGVGLMLGKSDAILAVKAFIKKVASTDANILMYGESGTGKELAARAIHDHSGRTAQPFVPVDCVALPDTLLESELFGHEKGAFTGAHAAKAGLFEVANGGTVFLDEVSEMSPMLQSRLLRVLQERHVRRVGGTGYTDIDVRVIAASNRNLEEACRNGLFREDLYYRLNVIPILLPPLRERQDDVQVLAETFLQRFMARKRCTGHERASFAPLALSRLQAHTWPGNVRELQNVVERAAALSDGPMIGVQHLPDHLCPVPREHASHQDVASFKEAKRSVVRTFERSFLIELLKRHGGQQGRAAQEAGVDRKTIERMVKKYGLGDL